MTVNEFIKELKRINTDSWGYGNEVMYLMSQEPLDLNDKDKLSGAIWLIGRAYAASPQRRSYGTTENNEGYININGDIPKKRPVWPVRTQNDGRDGFFDEIARSIKESISHDSMFQKLITAYSENRSAYSYDYSEKDIQTLTESILAVLQYNLYLSQALEEYDEVPIGHMFNFDPVYCSNHISFSSKFLHFYFPHRVFIIDSFACDGGKYLFNGNESTKLRAFYDAPSKGADAFNDSIYKLFSKEKASEIYTTITGNASIKTNTDIYDKRTRKSTASYENSSAARDYIEHCIRSYLLGCFITNDTKIVPINQIRYSTSFSVNSMPRLTDAVFLNIKAPITGAVENHYRSVKEVYGIKYIKI